MPVDVGGPPIDVGELPIDVGDQLLMLELLIGVGECLLMWENHRGSPDDVGGLAIDGG